MYRSLDPAQLVDSVDQLVARIEDRFPGSGLAGVCRELRDVAREARARAAGFERPLVGLRVATLGLVGLIVAALVAGLAQSRTPDEPYALGSLLGLLDAGANVLFLGGGAALFLVTFERRVRRNRVLRALHELRSMAHVIDMHQLTKDPARVLEPGAAWLSTSPRLALTPFELTRYLDYCSEMLAHVGKLGALYVQGFEDPAAVEAASDLEAMTTGLSRKVWQKIMILRDVTPEDAARA